MNNEFKSVWGKILVELKEQGRKSIYAEAIDVKNGEIAEDKLTAFVKTKTSLLFKKENILIIEDILKFIFLKNIAFVPKEFDEDKIKKERLKKLFEDGELEII